MHATHAIARRIALGLRRARVPLLLVLASAVPLGCGSGGAGDSGGEGDGVPSLNQTWEFDLFDENGMFVDSATALLTGGSTSEPARSWTLLTEADFGCSFSIEFHVQFSGRAVRLLLFQKSAESTCGAATLGPTTGTGDADAEFATATTAIGSVTIDMNTPVGPSRGTFGWLARRVP
jgi:hypothetical protein